MSYILLVLTIVSGGQTLHTETFATRAACEAAREWVLTPPLRPGYSIRATCLPRS
jgi:hypothetical protein